MSSVAIQLTPAEIFQGAISGVMRQAQNIQRQHHGAHGANNQNDWQMHIEGALAEFAVAKHLNVFWSGKLGLYTPGDVGSIEVRSSQKYENSLIVRKGDLDQAKFVFLTGVNGSYLIHGWITGFEAKQDRYLRSPNGREPAYFVPKNKLYSIETLGEYDGISQFAA